MKATFQKEVQGLTGCVVSVSLDFSEHALSQLYEDSEDAHGIAGQSRLLGALLLETVNLLDQAEMSISSNRLETCKATLSGE